MTWTPQVAVLVPCLNEEAAIARVVSDFRAALPDALVFVYDNASTDRTTEAARAAGVKDILINAPYNQEVTCSLRADSLESACNYILAQGR